MSKKYNVAVVGATGAVGQAILEILAERNFPVNEIYALASARSVGKKVLYGEHYLTVADLDEFDFSQVEIGLFSAGGSVSEKYAQRAVDAGCIVIDNTSFFRLDADIPLVVPEVNAEKIKDYKDKGIIANPNCSTIQMLVAIKPIYDAVGIDRINVCTYQAVSGTGVDAIEELAVQTGDLLAGKATTCGVYPKQIAFNALPHIDDFTQNGYTKEEMKMVLETRKILGDDKIKINPTAVRVAVFYGHSEALHIETKDKITADKARQILKNAPGIKVLDEQEDGGYATAVTEGANSDFVYVSRIREDISHSKGLNFWVVADNVRKGAALNSVQIAENLIEFFI